MNYICSSEEMMELDRITMEEIGISSPVLMERAALAAYEEICRRYFPEKRVLVLVGAGNNGGDGLALSRMLSVGGYHVQVLLIGERARTEECERQLNIIHEIKKRHEEEDIWRGEGRLAVSRLTTPEEADALLEKHYDIVVDSIFGIGLTRELASPEADVLQAVNQMKAYKVAIDICSGLDANTGKVKGIAFQADVTITFGYKKVGMLVGDGPECSGEVVVKDIGFPGCVAEQVKPQLFTYDYKDLSGLPKRRPNSNKGNYGKVVIIAGSEEMEGAAFLSAAAAYRSGAGLVKIYSHSRNRDLLLKQLPEAIFAAYDEAPETVIAEACEFGDIIVIGPGLGQSDLAKQLVQASLMQEQVPVLADADALNILALNKDWIMEKKAELILTPHIGEMSRLTGLDISVIKNTCLSLAKHFASKHKCVLVLKDAKTLVTDGLCPMFMNDTGNHGMSTGGSGDVLTGVIAAFAAGGLSAKRAAELGVYVHGLAGDAIALHMGKRGMIAGDLLTGLTLVLKEY